MFGSSLAAHTRQIGRFKPWSSTLTEERKVTSNTWRHGSWDWTETSITTISLHDALKHCLLTLFDGHATHRNVWILLTLYDISTDSGAAHYNWSLFDIDISYRWHRLFLQVRSTFPTGDINISYRWHRHFLQVNIAINWRQLNLFGIKMASMATLRTTWHRHRPIIDMIPKYTRL